MNTIDPSKVKAGDTVTLENGTTTVEGKAGTQHTRGDLTALSIHAVGTLYLRDGWTITDHQPAPQPEWKPGTPGTATLNNRVSGNGSAGLRAMRFRTQDGLEGFALENGLQIGDDATTYSVTDFVPDDAEALRRQIEADSDVNYLLREENEHYKAEVERLRAKTLPTDLTKCICPWDSEDRGGGHSEIVAEYEPACPVHSEHVYDPRQGMWVERAARTLPKRERVAKALGEHGAWSSSDDGAECECGDSISSAGEYAPTLWYAHLADVVLPLFEQGGAASKVTEAQAVEAIKARLSWPSLHWGAESLHPDALPHIANAVRALYTGGAE